MSQNGIAWLPTKEARQIAKLDLAAQKRGESYDIDLLPTKYDGNDVINNPNTGGLQPHRPWTSGSPPPPPPTGNDFFFAGDQNNWIIDGGFNAGSTFSSPPPSNPAYTYPDGSYTGKTYNFDGTTWMSSMNLHINNSWTTNAITIDFWFYPTSNGVQLMSESDHADVTSGYHYSVLEIASDGKVHAKFYNGSYPNFEIVSTNTVDLNKWNHIWFQETTGGDHNFTLNNVAVTGTANYTRVPPTSAEFFLIGLADTTKITATGRFQGKIGWLTIHDYAVASTWNDQHTRFRPAPTYTLATAGSVTSINEGVALTFNVTTTNIDNGTTLYWFVDGQLGQYTISSSRFTSNGIGSFTVNSNSATFTVTVSADSTTATSGQAYAIRLATGTSNFGTEAVGNTINITVNDTSQTPTGPTWPAPTNHAYGLRRNQYASAGEWDGTIAWFTGKTPDYSVTNNQYVMISESNSASGDTWEWKGYFVATSTGSVSFNFTGNSGTGANTAWFGNSAHAPTDSNAAINFTGNGSQTHTVTLTTGDYYPVRVVSGINPSGGGMAFSVNGSGLSTSVIWNDGSHAAYNTDTGGI